MGDWKKPMSGLVKSVRDYLDAGYRELKAEFARSREESERREAARQAQMVCPKCAASIPDGERFCKICGAAEGITRREFEAGEAKRREAEAERATHERDLKRKSRAKKMAEFEDARRIRTFDRERGRREAEERELLERKFQELRRTPICPSCRALYPEDVAAPGSESVRRHCGRCGETVRLVCDLFSEEELNSWGSIGADERR